MTQSGVIPYKVKSKELYVLLVSNRKGKRWIIPKGSIKTKLTPQESAQIEAFEEAGVIGKIHAEPVGNFKIEKQRNSCNIIVYPLKVKKVHDTWREDNFRKRKWFKVETAIDKVHNEELKGLLKNFKEKYD